MSISSQNNPYFSGKFLPNLSLKGKDNSEVRKSFESKFLPGRQFKLPSQLRSALNSFTNKANSQHTTLAPKDWENIVASGKADSYWRETKQENTSSKNPNLAK